jgi:hypothetical protein
VAEGNIVLVETANESLDIFHSALKGLFTTFHQGMNTYTPSARLRKQYPKD